MVLFHFYLENRFLLHNCRRHLRTVTSGRRDDDDDDGDHDGGNDDERFFRGGVFNDDDDDDRKKKRKTSRRLFLRQRRKAEGVASEEHQHPSSSSSHWTSSRKWDTFVCGGGDVLVGLSPGRSESGETVADAIVVVAGGFTPDNSWLPEWVLERLDYCAEAYKRAEGKPYICIAGSATPPQISSVTKRRIYLPRVNDDGGIFNR